jgi:hypothetical protein
MLMPLMQIDFQLTAIAPKGSRKAKGKGRARVKMPTSVMNRGLSLDPDHRKEFISESIPGCTQIYKVCRIRDARALYLFYEIIFVEPVMTRHFSKFQPMWPHHRHRSSPFPEWCVAFRSYLGKMYDTTHDQMNNWRLDNHRAFGDKVDHTNLLTTCLGTVKRTGQDFSWYGYDNPLAMIELSSCR